MLRQHRHVLALATATLVGAAQAGGVMERLHASFEGPVENLFPDPQDQALTRIRDLPDQLIWLHRQSRAATHRKLTLGGGVDSMLADALAEKHQAHSWAFTKRLREELQAGEDRRLRGLLESLEAPPLPADRAAFEPVLTRLPPPLRARVAGFEAAVEAAGRELEDPQHLAAYVAAAEAAPDFYRKKGALRRLAARTREGVAGLVDRLELRFSKENLTRFFARIATSRLSPAVRARAGEAVADLGTSLVDAVLQDLDDQIEGGLGSKVQSIESAGGYLRVKTAGTRGRLRVLLKLMQALKDDPGELRLFMPTFRQVRQGIKQRLRRSDLDAAGRGTLAKLDETLETSSLFMERWARAPASETGPMNVWEAVWKALKAEDVEGLFVELAAAPEGL